MPEVHWETKKRTVILGDAFLSFDSRFSNLPFFSSSPNEQYVGCKEYCPWFTPTNGEFLECNDKSTCDIGSKSRSCCSGRGGLAKCAKSYPVMCEDRALYSSVMNYTCRRSTFNDDSSCETTNRKCYGYGEFISVDAPFRPKMKREGSIWPCNMKEMFSYLFVRCIIY